MNIVVISKRKNLLFFGTNEVPKGVMGLKIDFVRGKEKTNYEPFEINTIEDFQEACVTEKAKSKKTINGFLSSGDYRENQVFIVPEGWEEGSIDMGYEMACELLNSVGQIKPFNLRFVSMHTREQLLRMVKKENKTLVETFPHYCFFDDQVTLIPEAYSTAHFRLIKDIAVSDSGRLSLIKHEVKNIVEEKLDDQHLSEATERFKRHALKILDDLDCPAYTNCYSDCKRELDDLQQKVHGITASTSIDELKGISSKVQNDILQLIQDINIRLPRVNPQESLPNAKKNYRVLIIEDNLDQRTSLYHFFNKHYEFVCCNDLRETIDDVEYEQWKRQLETTYCGADVKRIKVVEGVLKSLESKNDLNYDRLKSLNDKLEEILQGSNNKVWTEKEKFSNDVENLKGKNNFSKPELRPLIVELKDILNELDKSLSGETKGIREAITAITLKDYESAMAWINNIKDWGNRFDIMILDLLLKGKDNETWLPFNGLDLLCGIRKNIPYSTVRVITSLPRHEVGSILKEEGIVIPMNQIFTKGNGWPQLEGCLYDRLDEINAECKENESRRRVVEEISMPDKGEFFSHSEVREHVQKLVMNGEFQSVFEKAQSMIDPNTSRDPIKLMGKHGFNKDQVGLLFVNYLAHRFAFLNWASTAGTQISMQGINYTSYADKAKSYHIERNVEKKIYYNSIGFNTSGSYCVNLNAEKMFPEELNYYIGQMAHTLVEEEISKTMLKWCVCVVRQLLSKNASVCNNAKFMSFCTAIDNKTLTMDCVFDLLDECVKYSDIYDEYKDVIGKICQQKWFKDMPCIIEELKRFEEQRSLPANISSVIESYTII